MQKKQYKKQSDLIRHAIKNIDILTYDEKLVKNILILSGIRSPSLELIQGTMENIT